MRPNKHAIGPKEAVALGFVQVFPNALSILFE